MNNDRSIALYQAIKSSDERRVFKRFIDKVSIVDSQDCWLWKGNVRPNGYGKLFYNGKLDGAHRVAYMLFKGDIENKMVIDHICHNTVDCVAEGKAGSCIHRSCVNPEHLQKVTSSENTRLGRAFERRKVKELARTHCKNGHLMSKENTYVRPTSSWSRACRACLRVSQKNYRKRLVAA